MDHSVGGDGGCVAVGFVVGFVVVSVVLFVVVVDLVVVVVDLAFVAFCGVFGVFGAGDDRGGGGGCGCWLLCCYALLERTVWDTEARVHEAANPNGDAKQDLALRNERRSLRVTKSVAIRSFWLARAGQPSRGRRYRTEGGGASREPTAWPLHIRCESTDENTRLLIVCVLLLSVLTCPCRVMAAEAV